ncbi:hypothetical protein OV090_18420 [Nannocystis sp. RBIL2]|uniref:hypothetical protein n=1 Tax=Nannocystis sp. RBIL2 TaxID=2996788 RepID=UPI002271CB9D|nr:hypothetical protein [Nannocystis sp. RBIL2]MCY1066756.1 hypothetical protein [Nannocystis sp. RBIL2]
MGRLAAHFSDRSADAVALELHARWPAGLGERPANPRSLGNRLRELDRGANLEWWRKRGPLMQLLARVLEIDEGELEPLLNDATGTPETAPRFAAIGELRPLALEREELFPGLPEEALAPERWTRHWWHLSDGIMRDLVARWHEHHSRAAVVRKPTWEEALPDLPRSGRVLLVLDAPPRLPLGVSPESPLAHLPVVDLDAEDAPGSGSLGDLPGLFLCVLAPYDVGSDMGVATAPDGWQMLHWPDPERWIESLAAWARERARKGGGLRKKSARTRLPEALQRYARWFDGPREALELCALFDEIGCREHDGRMLARRYLQSLWRVHEGALGSRYAWLREQGFSTLLALIEEAMFRHGEAWLKGLPRAAWEALVPVEALARDVDGARALLQRGELTEALRKQVLAKLEPSTRRLVEDLVVTGTLCARAGGRWKLTPHWLAMCLREAVLEDMFSASFDVWTARLAQPVVANLAVQALTRCLAAGDFTRLDEVLARTTDLEYTHLLAVDTCVRAAGLALLHGAELPRERLAALWRALGRTLQSGGPDVLPQLPFSGTSDQTNLGDRVLAVACMLITEVLTEDEAGTFATLWRPDSDPLMAWAIHGPVAVWFGELWKRPRSQALDGLLRLGARILARCGPPRAEVRVNELVLPAWVTRELLTDEPAVEIWRYLRTWRIASVLPALMQRHCELVGLPFAQVIERAWQAWDPSAHHGEPHPWSRWARDALRQAALVWKYLPVEVMRGHLRPHLMAPQTQLYPNAWRLFERVQWDAWLELAQEDPDLSNRDEWVSAWKFAPEDLVASALAKGLLEAFPRGVFGIAWQRLGQVLPGQLAELRRERPRTAWSLLQQAPEAQREVCLGLLLAWLDTLDVDEMAQAESFLRRILATRGPLAPRAWDGLRRLSARSR